MCACVCVCMCVCVCVHVRSSTGVRTGMMIRKCTSLGLWFVGCGSCTSPWLRHSYTGQPTYNRTPTAWGYVSLTRTHARRHTRRLVLAFYILVGAAAAGLASQIGPSDKSIGDIWPENHMLTREGVASTSLFIDAEFSYVRSGQHTRSSRACWFGEPTLIAVDAAAFFVDVCADRVCVFRRGAAALGLGAMFCT